MEILETKCLWEKLQTATKPILLYGLGDGADKVINALNSYGIKMSGVFCSDELFREKTFHGYKVMKYSTAKEIFGDMIVLMCFGTALDSVINLAKNIAQEQEFYVPDVPVFGDGLFDRAFYENHKSELEWVYDRLADDSSRHVFSSVINYKLSGKAEYLFNCETDNDEAFSKVLRIGPNETFLDLGAYDGDTVNEFVTYTKGIYKSITAVEPDRKNFKKLNRNTKGIDRLECINAAVSDRTGTAIFDCKGGRSSYLTENGKDEISLVSIDSLNKPFTYIKMDVEGNELKSIAGAEHTLKTYKPKMLISGYHRNEDMFVIPKAVLEINPDYSIYIRHYRYLPAWDTNFYFI